MPRRPLRAVGLSILALLALGFLYLHLTGGLHIPSTHQATVNETLELEPVAENLSFPVSVAVAPDGRIFFNERETGQVRLLIDGALQPDPVLRENVTVDLDTGLIGLALHPDFPRDPWIYVYYTDRDDDGDLRGHVVRHRLEGNRSVAREVIVPDLPAARMHSGGIVEFGPEGNLYVSVGDAEAQWWVPLPWTQNGKILTYTPTGERVENPAFPFSDAYSLGHRNVFGMAWDPRTGVLYATENGPEDADELNRIEPGKNYGWPWTRGHSHMPFQAPTLAYREIIAPTEAAFYTGDKLHPSHTNNLFFGAWDERSIHRVLVDPDTGRVLADEIAHQGAFILDVEDGPDGHLYVSTPTGIYRATLAR